MSDFQPCNKCSTLRELDCACPNIDCQDFLNPNIATPTTGNREQDVAILRNATESQDEIKHGRCPNKDGGRLVVTGPGTLTCPICSFVMTVRNL